MKAHKEHKRTWVLFVIALAGIAVMLYAVKLSTRPYTQADEGYGDVIAQFKQWLSEKRAMESSTGCGGICQDAGFGGGREGKVCKAVCVNVIGKGKDCENQCSRLGKNSANRCIQQLCPIIEDAMTPTSTPTP
ncbi:MAG TPA: hypothetical protein VJB96_04980 [Patescibacteria group bacterium]|nr:hypothetical protein [Patescibacteria group bacterium]